MDTTSIIELIDKIDSLLETAKGEVQNASTAAEEAKDKVDFAESEADDAYRRLDEIESHLCDLREQLDELNLEGDEEGTSAMQKDINRWKKRVLALHQRGNNPEQIASKLEIGNFLVSRILEANAT